MMVEISVNSKFATRLNLVQPSPDVIGIGDHAVYTGQNLQEFEHRPTIHKIEDVPYAHGESLHYIERQLLFLGISNSLHLTCRGSGKSRKAASAAFVGKKSSK